MNELQLVLLVFAVVVIGALYFLSKKRQTKSQESKAESSHSTKSTDVNSTNNHSQESHSDSAPSMNNTQHFNQINPSDEPSVPENQASFTFGDEINQQNSEVESPTQMPNDSEIETIELEKVDVHTKQGKKHHVLEVDDLYSISDVGGSADDAPKTNFGIPADTAPAANHTPSKSKGEHHVFALLVLSTGGSGQEFSMDAVNQALLGVGLHLSQNNIYVTTDSQGTEIIRVANIMEPGSFPTENFHAHTTPGLAIILELPSSVRAPRATHDLIMIARKVSQRLNGRLYNMERHLIKESDLQAMRDAAVDYESEPL